MMKKILLLPDSFKGTLTSRQVCQIMEEAIHRELPCCQVVSLPVADGGEGSVDCFLTALAGERRHCTVQGPLGEPIEGVYALLEGGHTAVIEMAAAAGLPLVGDRKNPLLTSTYGVGQLIADGVAQGAHKLIVGLGGSATNDGAAGAMAALGARFYRESAEEFIPTGGTLEEIARIDASGLLPQLQECEMIAMCDIDNPMYGPTGAAYIFGPQKGATPPMVEQLDRGLRHYAAQLEKWLGCTVADLPGAGAAGAMGAGLVAFLHARLTPGIEAVLDAVHFEEQATGADLIFTGEGLLDHQSLRGKVVIGVGRRAKALGIPVVAVVGGCADDLGDLRDRGVQASFGIARRPQPLEEALGRAEKNLQATMGEIVKLLALSSQGRV